MATPQWMNWLDEYKAFLSIVSGDTSIPEEQILISLEFGYFATTNIRCAFDEFALKFLSFMYGGYMLLKQNQIKNVKDGITNWSLNGVSISFDLNGTRTTAQDFHDEWKRLIKQLCIKNRKPSSSFVFTNTGTGLWQSTRAYGPLYVRIGSGGTGTGTAPLPPV